MRCAHRPPFSFFRYKRPRLNSIDAASDLGAAEAERVLSATAAPSGAPASDHRSRTEPRAPLPPSQFRASFHLSRHRTRPAPLSDPAGPPNTNAGKALRPSAAFLLLPPFSASLQFENCCRAILEPLKLNEPRARLQSDSECGLMTTDRALSRARRCRNPSFALT